MKRNALIVVGIDQGPIVHPNPSDSNCKRLGRVEDVIGVFNRRALILAVIIAQGQAFGLFRWVRHKFQFLSSV